MADCNRGRLTQYAAALALGMSGRNLRRHVCRFESEGGHQTPVQRNPIQPCNHNKINVFWLFLVRVSPIRFIDIRVYSGVFSGV
jgi:hypothetical protein